jgi:TadE-like protein
MTEFALVAPVMLALMGIAVDGARLYFTWVSLESATRDAAQYVASDPGLLVSGGNYLTGGGYYDPNDATNYCGASWVTCTTQPSTNAQTVLQNETGKTFTKSATLASCTASTPSPAVWAILSAPDTTTANGGSSSYPVAKAEVKACMPFRTLIAYPVISNNGTWVTRSDRTISTIVGR